VWCKQTANKLCGVNSFVSKWRGVEDTTQEAVTYEVEKWQAQQNLIDNNPSTLPHILSVFNNNC